MLSLIACAFVLLTGMEFNNYYEREVKALKERVCKLESETKEGCENFNED